MPTVDQVTPAQVEHEIRYPLLCKVLASNKDTDLNVWTSLFYIQPRLQNMIYSSGSS